jgi:hypothetical protein
MRRMICVLRGSALIVALSLLGATKSPLKDLLARAGAYVQQFEDGFSTVISLETYEQHAEQRRESPPRAWLTISDESRTLRSEMLFTRLSERRAWLTVRNVLAVDGQTVPDSADRLERALAESGSAGLLRALADEGARFNLGRIRRNVNDPTFALRFLSRSSQDGFEYALQGREAVNGVSAWKLAFRERSSPSLVRNARNEDLPASGGIWLSEVDAAVVRTTTIISDKRARLSATATVDYGRDVKLDMWVPVRMSETYIQRTGNIEERIVCTATYSDFRRFETSGRLVSPG